MPSMANITVKDSDGTTDVVFNAMTPSSGDSNPAVWRVEAAGSGVAANRPRCEVRARNNADRTARRIDFYLTVPHFVTDSETSETKIVSNIPVNLTMTVPMNVPDSRVASAAAYLGNLLDSSLLQDVFKSGFAPT